jgi:hypothetical protein
LVDSHCSRHGLWKVRLPREQENPFSWFCPFFIFLNLLFYYSLFPFPVAQHYRLVLNRGLWKVRLPREQENPFSWSWTLGTWKK